MKYYHLIFLLFVVFLLNFLPKFLNKEGFRENLNVINSPEYSKVTFKYNNKFVNITHNRLDNTYSSYSSYYLQDVFFGFKSIKVITNKDKKYFILTSNNKIKLTTTSPTIDNIKKYSYIYYDPIQSGYEHIQSGQACKIYSFKLMDNERPDKNTAMIYNVDNNILKRTKPLNIKDKKNSIFYMENIQ